MNEDDFEWDKAKAAQNQVDHGVSFEAAKRVFKDPFATERLDDRADYGEDRYSIIGMVDGRVLCVVYTLRNGGNYSNHLRARSRTMKNVDTTKTTPERAESVRTDWSRFDAMTDAQRHQAALNDPDARPLTGDDLDRMKRTPQVKIVRRALGLSQEDFAARYHIPLGALRDWEQGRVEPDQATRAYLTVIARAPDGPRRAQSAETMKARL